MMGGMEQVIQEFLAESFENLDRLDQDLVSLEKHPDDRQVFERIFRTIHTIKGTCGFLAFGRLEEVTHAGESMLSLLRDGRLELRPEITTQLLALMDAVREMLRSIEITGAEGDADYSALVAALSAIERDARAAADEKKKTGEVNPPPAATPSPAALSDQHLPPRRRRAERSRARVTIEIDDSDGAQDHPPSSLATEGQVVARTKAGETSADVGMPPAEVAASARTHPDRTTVAGRPGAVQSETAPEAEVVDAPSASALAENSIRVDVSVLDQLMNLVGELVLARNQILQRTSALSDQGLIASAQRLNGVTGELQEAVMKTRMQPISSIWSKLPRFVRDLALKCGKEVELEMEGQETELDKAVIEAMKGSILHLVRNSIDHGIESPSQREGRGKSPAGRLSLRAAHEGGYVVIEVRDDGGGLDRSKILERAVARGVISADRAATLSPREVERLVFLPGFSTASSVTNVSGRGVGMDVVRTNVEGIGGSLDLQSEPGVSTTVRMKIPLTLAIIPVLIVTTCGHRFAIPQVSVVELVRLDRDRAERGIERIHGVPVYRLRGRLLPLVYLSEELKIGEGSRSEVEEGKANIVVLHGDERQFGLVVDSIDDSQEIVVKPLGSRLHGLPFGGATILGDGRVALILDVFRVGLTAGLVSEVRERIMAEQAAAQVEVEEQILTRLLYVQGPDDERMAIPFSLVSRLEFLPRGRIERVGVQRVIQYRGDILQLIDVADTLPERRQQRRRGDEDGGADAMQVVVCSIEARRVGLVVHRILDIVDESLEVSRPASRAGVESCVVIRERVTEIIDVAALVRMVDPQFFDRPVGRSKAVS